MNYFSYKEMHLLDLLINFLKLLYLSLFKHLKIPSTKEVFSSESGLKIVETITIVDI